MVWEKTKCTHFVFTLERLICCFLSPQNGQSLCDDFDVYTLDKGLKSASYKGLYVDAKMKHTIFKNALKCDPNKNYIFVTRQWKLVCICINTQHARDLSKYGGCLFQMSEYYNLIERKGVASQYKGAMYGYGVRGGYEPGVAYASYATKVQPSEYCLQLESFMLDLARVGAMYFPELWHKVKVAAADILPDDIYREGCVYPSMTQTTNFTSMQHKDNDFPGIPAIGFWCDYSDTSQAVPEGGEFLFSEWNILIPFSGEGSVLIWDSNEEHGTTKYLTCHFQGNHKDVSIFFFFYKVKILKFDQINIRLVHPCKLHKPLLTDANNS